MRACSCLQDEDTINTVEEQTRLKDIPVPLSLPQERACGTDVFQLPEHFIRPPPPHAVAGASCSECVM